MGKFFRESAGSLGDFVCVVDGDVVDSASVDVDWLAELFVDDGGTFEMPTWVAWTTEEIPAHGVGFAGFDEFPDSKVGTISFFRRKINTRAGLWFLRSRRAKSA